MPEMDGMELAKEIRKLPGGEVLPLVLFTSLGGARWRPTAWILPAT